MVVYQLIADSCSFRLVNYPPRSWAISIGCCCDDVAAINDWEVVGVGYFDDGVVIVVGCGYE